MRKSNYIYLFLTAWLLSSCAAHFDRYPGEKLTTFPQQLQGDYCFANKPFFMSWFKKDTAILHISPTSIVRLADNEQTKPLLLNDTVVLSSFGKYYALSQRDENIEGAWTVSIIRADRPSLSLWVVEENKPYARVLLSQLASQTYVRQPGQNWNKLAATQEVKARAMKNSHSDTAVVFTMNDAVLLQLFEKHIQKERPVILKRYK